MKLKVSSEVLIFVLGFGVLIYAFLQAGLAEWAAFWGAVGLLLGGFEAYAVAKSGETLSEKFGKVIKENPKVGWTLWGLLAAAFAALLWHLLAMR